MPVAGGVGGAGVEGDGPPGRTGVPAAEGGGARRAPDEEAGASAGGLGEAEGRFFDFDADALLGISFPSEGGKVKPDP